jgi:hypothetical protein
MSLAPEQFRAFSPSLIGWTQRTLAKHAKRALHVSGATPSGQQHGALARLPLLDAIFGYFRGFDARKSLPVRDRTI